MAVAPAGATARPFCYQVRMRIRLLASLAALLLASSACVQPAGGSRTGQSGDYDLFDLQLQSELGSPAVEDPDWQRIMGGVEVLGVGTRPVPGELALIEGALAEVPEALAAVASPRAVVRVHQADAGELHPAALAFSKGPDVFLIDRVFAISDGTSTRFDLARAYLHELAHIAQFYTLDADYIDAALAGRVESVDPTVGSGLVRSFAEDNGWTNMSGDPLRPSWTLASGQIPSTSYGAQSPGEDMAEAVALVALGQADLVPEGRVRWVERWLDAEADQLAAGKPWAPAGATEVLSRQPVYDEDRLAQAAVGFQHAEPMYFSLPLDSPDHASLAAEVQRRLLDRDLLGALLRVEDERLPRYAGSFTRRDGVAFWVELWDFRTAIGFRSAPEEPVLTYVVLW